MTGLSTLFRPAAGRFSVNRRSQLGKEMVEYGFILVLIALVVIVMLVTAGEQARNFRGYHSHAAQ
jgi:Flp pilus assembly pilin Flp